MPNNFLRCLDPEDYPPIQPIIIEDGGRVVVGPDGTRHYQEVGQTVAELVQAGDVIRTNYHTGHPSIGKRIVVSVTPSTECTCTDAMCANRIGAGHPAAEPTGEHCHLLKCWTIRHIETGRTQFRADGKYRDGQLCYVTEYVARAGKIVSLYDDNDDCVEVVEHGAIKGIVRQIPLFVRVG